MFVCVWKGGGCEGAETLQRVKELLEKDLSAVCRSQTFKANYNWRENWCGATTEDAQLFSKGWMGAWPTFQSSVISASVSHRPRDSWRETCAVAKKHPRLRAKSHGRVEILHRNPIRCKYGFPVEFWRLCRLCQICREKLAFLLKLQ